MHAFIIYNRHISILLLIATPPNFACVDSGRCIGKSLVPAQAAHCTHRATSRYGNSIQSRYRYQWNISERDTNTNTNITYLDHPRSKYQYASTYIYILETSMIRSKCRCHQQITKNSSLIAEPPKLGSNTPQWHGKISTPFECTTWSDVKGRWKASDLLKWSLMVIKYVPDCDVALSSRDIFTQISSCERDSARTGYDWLIFAVEAGAPLCESGRV